MGNRHVCHVQLSIKTGLFDNCKKSLNGKCCYLLGLIFPIIPILSTEKLDVSIFSIFAFIIACWNSKENQRDKSFSVKIREKLEQYRIERQCFQCSYKLPDEVISKT